MEYFAVVLILWGFQVKNIMWWKTLLRITLAESWMSFLRAHTITRRYAAKMAPTKQTTTGLLVNVAKSSAVRDTSTKFGMTKKVLPKKVKWVQRHWVIKGVVSGPTWRKKESQSVRLHSSLLKNVLMETTMDVCEFFLTNPAAIFTPRRLGFIPVFALGSNQIDSDSGIDGFDTWLHNGLHNKVVYSNIWCSVFGTQHPGILFLCVKMTDAFI